MLQLPHIAMVMARWRHSFIPHKVAISGPNGLQTNSTNVAAGRPGFPVRIPVRVVRVSEGKWWHVQGRRSHPSGQLLRVPWRHGRAEHLHPIPDKAEVVRVALGVVVRAEVLVGCRVLRREENVEPAQAANKPAEDPHLRPSSHVALRARSTV